MSKCIYALLASAMLVTPALAQSNPPSPAPAPMASTTAPMSNSGQWRASKLIGVNVYNDQNEKLGDINEVLLDKSGKAHGVIIGVGGFLGMGEHNVMVSFDKLKWVNEPVRTSATTTAPATTGTNVQARPARSATEKWYPDHAVLSATKDQLKAMTQFKYN
jgi:sporulation protein YlmC with PRC-barrel domain